MEVLGDSVNIHFTQICLEGANFVTNQLDQWHELSFYLDQNPFKAHQMYLITSLSTHGALRV